MGAESLISETLSKESELTKVIEIVGIGKKYPGVVANDNVNISIEGGSIHAIIGENGAGMSSLMKILFGLVKPDSGSIRVRGEELSFRSPQDAIAKGIGMVHQHFMLADNASVLENVILGSEPTGALGTINYGVARTKLIEISKRYGLELHPDQLVANLGVGERQRVEIAKVLFRGAQILILDEPTAVLVPQEVDELFTNLKGLTSNGLTIIFISHKLDEVLEIADAITVMRRGTTVANLLPGETSKKQLAEYMIGGELPEPHPGDSPRSDKRVLQVEGVSFTDGDGRKVINNLSLEIFGGEIVGLAGVEGNGQSELIELIMGLVKAESGKIEIIGLDAGSVTTREIRDAGVGYIPQDRHRDGLLLGASLWENRVLGHQGTAPMADGIWINKGAAKSDSERIVTEFDVRTPSINVAAHALSGGNQQKFIVGREMAGNPKVIIAAQPTRGVDVGAQAIIWNHLIAARKAGAAVLLISADLDEIFNLSDRIAVIFRGEITNYLDPKKATPETLGMAMTGEKIA